MQSNLTSALLKRVIIFGASGFIGARVYEHLQSLENVDIVGYSSAECDLLDQPRVSKLLDTCDRETSVVLCSGIARRKEDSWHAMMKNVEMVRNFATSIPPGGIRSVVFMSSVDVYGAQPDSLPIREDTKLNPNGYYALSKLTCEEVLRLEVSSSCPVALLRLPGVYGVGDRFESVVGKFIKQVLDNETTEITGDGAVKRDYVEVGNLCQVVEHFMRRPFAGVVNVATGRSTTIKDMHEIVAGVAGVTPKGHHLPDDNLRGDLEFDTNRLASLCPQVKFKDLEQGIAEYLSHVSASGEGPQLATRSR